MNMETRLQTTQIQFLQYTQRNKPLENGGQLNPAYDTEVDYDGHDRWLQRRKSRNISMDTAITLRLRVSIILQSMLVIYWVFN